MEEKIDGCVGRGGAARLFPALGATLSNQFSHMDNSMSLSHAVELLLEQKSKSTASNQLTFKQQI
jgi:hypothetical protein